MKITEFLIGINLCITIAIAGYCHSLRGEIIELRADIIELKSKLSETIDMLEDIDLDNFLNSLK